jgi:Carboxypeptidase regulatory-like domain
MKSSNQLDRLRIASPCPTNWEQMKGDQRVRFCELCSLHVYNIAELTAREAKSLIANTEGRVCARLYRRSDGTIITKDCPVGLRAIRRRVARTAGAVFATVLSLCGSAFSQKVKEDKSCRQQVKVTRNLSQGRIENGAVAGTILDPNGAVIPGAGITLVDVKSNESREVKSADDGRFLIPNVTPGVYVLVVKSPGFKNLELRALAVAGKETANVEATLLPAQEVGLVGVLADTSLIDTSSNLTTIISERMIRSLPIP